MRGQFGCYFTFCVWFRSCDFQECKGWTVLSDFVTYYYSSFSTHTQSNDWLVWKLAPSQDHTGPKVVCHVTEVPTYGIWSHISINCSVSLDAMLLRSFGYPSVRVIAFSNLNYSGFWKPGKNQGEVHTNWQKWLNSRTFHKEMSKHNHVHSVDGLPTLDMFVINSGQRKMPSDMPRILMTGQLQIYYGLLT